MTVILPVPAEICRNCGLCCRFSDPEVLTPWTTRIGEEGNLPIPFRASRPIHLTNGTGLMGLPVWQCSALDNQGFLCSLWEGHPADCRLYPLVLVRRAGTFLLALDMDCPFSSHVPRAFFTEWASRFRDEEWSRLSEPDLRQVQSLADHEDRPEYVSILSLPSTPRSFHDSA